jgi:acetolactate synthase regulatory subunit
MSATATYEAAPRQRAAGVEYLLDVRVRDSPDALVRVLATLRRRRCDITAVDFAAGDRHRPGWLKVAVLAPGATASSLPHWMANLVDVLEVCATERRA